MARVIIFNEEGEIIKDIPSAHTPDFEGHPRALVNPSVPVGSGPLARRARVSNGKIINKTPQEQDDFVKAVADEVKANEKVYAQALLRTIAEDPALRAQLQGLLFDR